MVSGQPSLYDSHGGGILPGLTGMVASTDFLASNTPRDALASNVSGGARCDDTLDLVPRIVRTWQPGGDAATLGHTSTSASAAHTPSGTASHTPAGPAAQSPRVAGLTPAV